MPSVLSIYFSSDTHPIDPNFHHSRTIGNIAGGCVAGLLGLTGRDGAAFYLVISVLISSTILVKTSFQAQKYLKSPTTTILFSGVFDRNSILTYVLFWTMLFSFH